MPNQPKTPTHPVRIPEDLWAEFGAVCEAQGTNRSADLRAYIEYKLRKPKVTLPPRSRGEGL